MNELIFTNVQKLEQLEKAKIEIIKRLKKTRLASKMSEQELSEWLKISRNTFRKLEKGDDIDLELLIKYGEKFGMTIDFLITLDE